MASSTRQQQQNQREDKREAEAQTAVTVQETLHSAPTERDWGTGPRRQRGHGRKRQASRSRAFLLQHAARFDQTSLAGLSFGMRARALTACTAALGRCVVPPEITSTHPAARPASRRHKGRKHRMLKTMISMSIIQLHDNKISYPPMIALKREKSPNQAYTTVCT